MKGMTTCKVCGRDFALMAEDHYVARDPQKVGAIANLVSTDIASEFDAFDCPHCGCQNVMQGRKALLSEKSECLCDSGVCGECDRPGEEEEIHDGCSGCAHEEVEMGEYPCNECKYSYSDLWERKENNDG